MKKIEEQERRERLAASMGLVR
jgi:hypothetical protein